MYWLFLVFGEQSNWWPAGLFRTKLYSLLRTKLYSLYSTKVSITYSKILTTRWAFHSSRYWYSWPLSIVWPPILPHNYGSEYTMAWSCTDARRLRWNRCQRIIVPMDSKIWCSYQNYFKPWTAIWVSRFCRINDNNWCNTSSNHLSYDDIEFLK